jgi:hypothetical protein
MNEMLSEEAKFQGIRYVFAIGSMSDMIKQRAKNSERSRRRRTTIIFNSLAN